MEKFRRENQQNIKMRKKEFFEELKEYLIGIPKAEKKEMLQDYEEHFKIGKVKKRSESEIIKSLGSPKQIAREMRREFSSSEKPELKSEAIETWVATKRFTKHLFNDAKDKISNLIQKDGNKKNDDFLPKIIFGGIIILALILIFNSWFFRIIAFLIIGYLIFDYFKTDKRNKSNTSKRVVDKTISKKKKGKTSATRVIISLAFNLLFFIWLWIGLFFGILGLFIASLTIVISGIMIIGFGIFALITHSNPLTKDILFSGLFSGIGVTILGGLFIGLSNLLIKYYFKLTRKYIQLNSRFIRK